MYIKEIPCTIFGDDIVTILSYICSFNQIIPKIDYESDFLNDSLSGCHSGVHRSRRQRHTARPVRRHQSDRRGSNATIGDAFFQRAEVNGGTGQFPAFLGIDTTGQANQEQAFNTFAPANCLPYDNMGSTHTTAIQLSNVPLVSYDNTLYRQFLLAVDQRRRRRTSLWTRSRYWYRTPAVTRPTPW
jgi:hypothetical protein